MKFKGLFKIIWIIGNFFKKLSIIYKDYVKIALDYGWKLNTVKSRTSDKTKESYFTKLFDMFFVRNNGRTLDMVDCTFYMH